MKTCVICGDETKRPLAAALHHFRLYERGQWVYLRGNIKTFGFLHGLHGTIGLAFPIYNTLRYWKHRKSRLVLPGGVSLATAFDGNGCALRSAAKEGKPDERVR